MDNVNYWKARSYAHRLEPDLYRDIVHDAFLDYHRTKGRNLFDEPLPIMFRAIKWKFYDFLKSKYGRADVKIHFEEYNDNIFDPVTPQEVLEEKELSTRIDNFQDIFKNSNKNTWLLKNILKLRREGFRIYEVAKELNVDDTAVIYYLRRLRIYLYGK